MFKKNSRYLDFALFKQGNLDIPFIEEKTLTFKWL